jgi:phosphate starvation-inducible protein PhoH and related proteins
VDNSLFKDKNVDATQHIILTPEDNQRLAKLCGQFNEHLQYIERHLGVEISNRGQEFQIIGIPASVEIAAKTLKTLYKDTSKKEPMTLSHIRLLIKSIESHAKEKTGKTSSREFKLKVNGAFIKSRTPNQQHYLEAISKNDINFGIGPSGTGKTFLAVACAISALEKEEVSRIVLVRPAVEAGESLGFLPGDLAQKVDPYLRPLYDALYEMMGINRINDLLAKGIIEIAPLAYMRGRTLNDSFVILDEGQNSTKEQMKMFLTRIGFGSKAVITGDITQVDLPKRIESGLRHAISLLQDIKGIQFSFFKSNDVVRHPIVQHIIEAYESE